jgi:hypothetical protein
MKKLRVGGWVSLFFLLPNFCGFLGSISSEIPIRGMPIAGIYSAEAGTRGTPKDSVNILITRDTLKNITIGLELYRQEYGEYPKTLDEFLSRKGITDKDIAKDGWGNPLYYTRLNDGYSLFSKGRDGKAFTDDDVHLE